MILAKEHIFTAEDYWNLPEEEHDELINGQFYNMALPSRIHQEISSYLHTTIGSYIRTNNGKCKIYSAPFAVCLHNDEKTYVEPDISVICEPSKLTDRGCKGAPDFIIEIVSPSSRKMDYCIKNTLYLEAGVREYWIVDPKIERTMIYHYETDETPAIFSFSDPIQVGIFQDLQITLSDSLK
ncbi:MAG: Uma2 family endonuclease [Lachnospiraceae bacterium]